MLKASDIMTKNVVTVTPDTAVMVILDVMIKKHIRRVPVVSGEKIEGMVYISDLFHRLVEMLAP